MLKVSVVVPVYNGGEHLDQCAGSLTGQSLGPGAYEILYVDDGSTDDSPARLERIAARHPHVRVHRQENSGWPGRPRNVGVRLARGAYVQFVDQDDELAPESLERLLALAERNNSDIVLGKVFGSMAGPSNVFRHTVARCTVEDAPLMESLTPHKMFRRSFLLDHGIRFPEGVVRLEDQLFMARAYVRAKTVSILGDYPAYEWKRRPDGGNTSSRAASADVYYRYLREVVDAVKEGTPPGPLQDRLLRRSYRVELLRPVTEPRVLQRSGAALRTYFDTVRSMALECYPPGVTAGLPAVTRLRARLLEEGRLDSLIELARRTQQIRPDAVVDAPPFWRNGGLVVRITVARLRGDGEPLALEERDGRLLLDPELLDGIEGAEDFEAGEPFAYASGELLVRDGGTGHWWFPDGGLTPELRELPVRGPGRGPRYQVVLTGESVIDPARLAGGLPLSAGDHDVWLNSQMLGIGRRARVADRQLPAPGAVSSAGRVVVAGWSGRYSQLHLTSGAPGRGPAVRRALVAAANRPATRNAADRALRCLPRSLRGDARKAARRVLRWSSGTGGRR